MKRSLSLFLVLLFFGSAFAEKQSAPAYSDEQVRAICDSIVVEGNLLYRYERAAWVGSDTIQANATVMKEHRFYLVYGVPDTIRYIGVNENLECVFEMDFVGDACMPQTPRTVKRALTSREMAELEMRDRISENLARGNYKIAIPPGSAPNFVFLPWEEGYKMYVMMGPNLPEMIPLGNDYLFVTNEQGEIVSWRKMHSGFLGVDMKMIREKGGVRELIHSHLRGEPFITATDICLLKLYGPLYGVDEITVLSTALGKYFTYHMDSDTVTVREALTGVE